MRSGGGNPNPGFGSAAENAVVLDLSLLNGIQLNAAKDIVSIGPGATWGTVYEYLEGHELTVVGGRVDGAGVGGVLSGGGMSHYTNHWGLGCDNVTNFEVALPDRLVQANVHDNQDLFRALKGGGSNFGTHVHCSGIVGLLSLPSVRNCDQIRPHHISRAQDVVPV